MPVTPESIEARAVAERMKAFAALEGNTHYLGKLATEDAATVNGLIPTLEATDGVDPAIVEGMRNAHAVLLSASTHSGHVELMSKVPAAGDALIAALDVIEAEAETKSGRTKRPESSAKEDRR